MPEIENLSISISTSAESAAKEIDTLAKRLEKLKGTLKDAEKSASDFGKGTQSIGAKVSDMVHVDASIQKTSAKIKELQKTAREPIKWFPDADSVKDAARDVARAVKTVGDSFKNMGSAVGGVVKGIIGGILKLGGAIARLGFKGLVNGAKLAARGLMSMASHAIRAAGALGKAAFHAAGAALSKIGGWAKTAAGGIANVVKHGTLLPLMFGKNLVAGIGAGIKSVGTLLSQFKRVAMYRAIRTVIKEITQGFQEGIKNLYAWSRGVGGEFAASMNRIATATQYLRNSLGALASPLIESLAPAIDFVIDKFVALINIVNQFLARLSGKSTYTAAKKAAAQWDSAASHAGSAANAMKRYTLAFDELNILGKSSSGGSGGGGGSSSGAGGMFEERAIEGDVSSFADDIVAAFNSQDWQAIGELLAGKFNDIVDSIPWPNIGDKIADGVNMALGVAHSFLVNFDFEGLGHDIADLFNHAIGNTDWELVGQYAGEKFGAVIRTITSLWDGIDFSVLGQRLSTGFNSFVDTVTNRINEVDWQWLGQKFSYGLNNLIGGIDWAGLGDMLIAGFSSTVDFLLSAVETFDWSKLGGAVRDLFGKVWSYDWNGLADRIVKDAKDALKELQSAFTGFSWEDAGTTFATIVNGIVGKIDWVGLGQTLRDMLSRTVTTLKHTVFHIEWGTAGKNLADAINELFEGDKAKELWEDVGTTFNTALNGALDFTINFVENFDVVDFANSVKAALANVDWPGIARKVWDLFAKAALKLGNFITVLFGGDPDPEPINQTIAKVKASVGKGDTSRNLTELDKQAGGYDQSTASQIGQAVGAALSTYYGWLKDTMDGMPWDEWGLKLGQDIRDFLDSIDWPDLGKKFGEAAFAILKGIDKVITYAIWGQDYENNKVWQYFHPKESSYLGQEKNRWTNRVEQNQNDPFEYSLTPEAAERLGGNYDRIVYDQYGNPHVMYDSEYRSEKLTNRDYTVTRKPDSTTEDAAQWMRQYVLPEFGKAQPTADYFSNFGNALSNWGSNVWNGIQEGANQHKYNVQAGKYTLLGGYYDVKEIGEGIGDKIANGPLGQLFSGASEQAKTEKALLNQAQFLVAAGKSVKEVSTELGLNTKQQKKLTDAMGISPAAAAFGYDNLSTDEIRWKLWGKNLGLSSEQNEAIIDVIFQPEGNLQTKYQNQGMMDWLKSIFAPGVDTKTRVELIKNGWKTLPEFVGTNKVLSTMVELVKKITGQTPATLFGTVLTVLAALAKKNGNDTPATLFGTILGVLATLGKKDNSQTPATLYETNKPLPISTFLQKTLGKGIADLYGTKLPVEVELKKKANNKLTYNLKPGDNNIMYLMKRGGSFYGGSWHGIPAYAGGTLNAGSMFVAGEAGPEIVGHVGGRTEVLNKSQLASTMFASVRAAMNPAVETFRAIGNSFSAAADRAMNAALYAADALYTTATDYSSGYTASGGDQSKDMDALLALVRQGSEATRQQNELLRQQNELLRQINDKDFGGDISPAMLSKAFQRMNLRAGTTVIPIGT